MKSISWTQSARLDRLMVKQYDYTTELRITVILNTEGGSAPALEHCYSLTRTVCETLEERGIPYDFRTNGNLPSATGLLSYVPEGLGRQHLNIILYGLGRAVSFTQFPLEQLLHRCALRSRANQGYILITPPLSRGQQQAVDRLRETAGRRLCVLTGEEGAL